MIKKIDKFVSQITHASRVGSEERRCDLDRRQCAERRSEARLGDESDRRQGGERRKYPVLQRLMH